MGRKRVTREAEPVRLSGGLFDAITGNPCFDGFGAFEDYAGKVGAGAGPGRSFDCKDPPLGKTGTDDTVPLPDGEKKERVRRSVITIVEPELKILRAENEDLRGQLVSMKDALAKIQKRGSRGTAIPGLKDELVKNPFSFQKAIMASCYEIAGKSGAWDKIAPYEREILDEGLKIRDEEQMKRRTMMAGDDVLGGFWVPDDVAEQFFIESLQPLTIIGSLNMQRLSGQTANKVIIPKETGLPTAYWVGESDSITASDITTGDLTLRPRELAAMVKLTAAFMRRSSVSVEAFVRRSIAKKFAQALNLVYFRGTGGEHQPLGIANWPGIQTKAQSGTTAALVYDDFEDIINLLEQANVLDPENWLWVFHAAAKGFIAKLKDAVSNKPYFTDDPSKAQPTRTLLGYPFRINNQLPTTLGAGSDETEIFFLDPSESIMVQWAGFEIAVSAQTSTAFEKRQVWIRAIQEVDFGLLQEDAFVMMPDFDLSP